MVRQANPVDVKAGRQVPDFGTEQGASKLGFEAANIEEHESGGQAALHRKRFIVVFLGARREGITVPSHQAQVERGWA
jgi:hypothetical protein